MKKLITRLEKCLEEAKKYSKDKNQASIEKELELVNEWVGNIESETLRNRNYRKVIHTATNCQLVVMSLQPGEDIGEEVHPAVDQFFRIEAGEGRVIIDDAEYDVSDGMAFIVPLGKKHNVVNISDKEPLLLYSIYSPPNHAPGVVHTTKKQAMDAE